MTDRCQSCVTSNHNVAYWRSNFDAPLHPKLCSPQDSNPDCLGARVRGQWTVVSL